MKLKAVDTLHVSSVGPEPIRPGQTFEVEDGAGKSLVARRLATEVAEKKAEPDVKAEPAPQNKAEPAPLNKDDVQPATKRARKS